MLIYLLKMIACSAAFYGLYALLFHNEKMLLFNRFYLLASLVVSFIIPLVSFTVYVNYSGDYTPGSTSQPVNSSSNWLNDGVIALAFISIIGSVILLARFIRSLARLKRRAGNSEQLLDFKGAKIILLSEPVVPHSFLNKIYLNSKEYQGHHIETEVLEHELAHVQQKHSWDILFIELLQIFCWLNPFIYLYKRSIKINHELLADAAVVKQLGDVRSYQVVLLQRATAQSSLALVSSFNFSTTKKRMIMLQKKTNPAIAGLKAILCLPLLTLMVFIFSERVYAQAPPPPPKPPSPGKVSKGKPSDVEVFIVESRNGKNSRAVIKYKNGKEISGDVSTAENKAAFEKTYGVELPPPPPPAPPTRKKKAVAPLPPPPAPIINKVKAQLPPPAPIFSKKTTLGEPLARPRSPKVAKMGAVAPILPPTPIKKNKAETTAVKSVEPIYTEIVAHILQFVESYYTATAAPKTTSDWGIDNPIETKSNF